MARAPDGFKYSRKDPLVEEHRLIDALLAEYITGEFGFWGTLQLKRSATGERIAACDPPESRRLVIALQPRIQHCEANYEKSDQGQKLLHSRLTLIQLFDALMRRRLPLTTDDLESMSQVLVDAKFHRLTTHASVLKGIADFAKKHPLTGTLEANLRNFAAALELANKAHNAKPLRKLAEQVDALLGTTPRLPVEQGEAWSEAALKDLASLPDDELTAWSEFLRHCRTASSAKPSAKWTRLAEEQLATIGAESFRARVCSWFPLVDKPRTAVIETWSEWGPDPNRMIIDPHMDLLRGLVWSTTLDPHPDTTRALTALAMSAYKKVPGIGPRATRVGNACVWALGQSPSEDALAQLAILKIRVKFGSAQKGIDKALNATAERMGVSREDLEEMAVPAYGMEEVGTRREQLGEFTAELVVTGTTSVELRWIKPDGKTQKSIPAAVKESHADDLADLRGAIKDIKKMLPAQRDRIDGLFLAKRSWPIHIWRERYLDHPLVGTISRRLIWSFTRHDTTVPGAWLDGELVDPEDQPLDPIDESTVVSLWHPLDSGTDVTLAWRSWLERHEIQQPFKQAHREIYVLTDAERNTDVYSNRYAAHVVKQHQFNALSTGRGWKSPLRMMVDDDLRPPSRELPQWDIRAEFWVESLGETFGTDTTETGSFLYLATDQVRFYGATAAPTSAHASGGSYTSHGHDVAGNQPLRLTEIPPIVFSELMRDCDLFVGVASVGNDPTWSDGGPEGRFREYWESYSFGELSGTAESRKEILSGLLPRLAIGPQCRIDGRFLIVKGEIRTYKIHLGSSNILMEPNDEYLCIVPAQGKAAAAGKVFLPFEGDNRLSVILSKALLLAADKKIKDATILSQINR